VSRAACRPCPPGHKVCPDGHCVPAILDCCGNGSCDEGLLCAQASSGRCCPVGNPVPCPDPRFCVPMGPEDLCETLAKIP